MEVIKTNIDGVVIIEPKVFGDNRGYFFESLSERDFNLQVREFKFVQDNESKSCFGVLRGLHFQEPPHAESKLVRAYHDTYGMPTIVTNCSNNYGPYQFPEKLIPLFINNIRNRKPLPV